MFDRFEFRPDVFANMVFAGLVSIVGAFAGASMALHHHRETSRRQRREDLAIEPLRAMHAALVGIAAFFQQARLAKDITSIQLSLERADAFILQALSQTQTAMAATAAHTADFTAKVAVIMAKAHVTSLAVRAGNAQVSALKNIEDEVLYASSKVRGDLRELLGLPPMAADLKVIRQLEAAMPKTREAMSGGTVARPGGEPGRSG